MKKSRIIADTAAIHANLSAYFLLVIALWEVNPAVAAIPPELSALQGPSAPLDSTRLPQIPHLDLEMTGHEYAALFENRALGLQTSREDNDTKALQPVLDLGKRNLQWLNWINLHRAAESKLSFTSKATVMAFPIEAPREYNVPIVLDRYNALRAALPETLSAILLGEGELPINPPTSDEQYLKWGLEVDRAYQIAARWIFSKPYLIQYAARKKLDIRGYYHLKHESDLAEKLNSWPTLPEPKKAQLREWLIGVCNNTNDQTRCTQEFDALRATGEAVTKFYSRYLGASQAVYESFFRMGWRRNDVEWDAHASNTMKLPFVDPRNSIVENYLRDNIQDEWRWNGWQLLLDFRKGSDSTTHIEFLPGVTPHVVVDRNAIVMDANQPTTEYESQWIIRHEFGHILGFVDCYLEFYDVDRALIVSYQIDTTNLMCSRRGVFQPIHFNQLKNAYFNKGHS